MSFISKHHSIFPKNVKRVEKPTLGEVFLTNLEAFENVVKHGVEC